MNKRTQIKKPNPIPFTQAGYDHLKVKQGELLLKRERVLVELQRAREQGDLSENGAYKAARFELSDTDRELRRLAHNIKYGVVKAPTGTDRIGFGNRITVQLEGKTFNYYLVGTFEADPFKGKISIESPLGMALLNKQVGEIATVKTPERTIEYIIQSIE